ncbi:MAG: 30S ribosomal protein S12 methylthiotransferase RimO [Legionellales bacterium]|nr:30S ribosomal protein S12 methylthiotransferase RimO [Legionellales bacterium]
MKVGFVSLGCPKALVDSERIITQLRARGYQLSRDYHDAGVVIINTCGFIDAAVEESLSTIEQALTENGKVIVTGCLGAKADFIRQRFPQVLHISGSQAYEQVVQAVQQHLPPPTDPFTSLIPATGIKLTPRHYAYLKIAEGCNHQCTFCIIPSMRGKLASRRIDQVLHEAEQLAQAGVKELLIIAQDTSAYGIDLHYQTGHWHERSWRSQFYDLCQALGELGIWVRLHYVYPYPHVDTVIELMAEHKILPYLDMPLQHANSRLLKLMKRPAKATNTLQRLQHWRTLCPELVLRSTFIVGFPGETDQDFADLLTFLEQAQLNRVGCFQYSPVAGATANQLPNPVPANIKQQRYDQLMQLQQQISMDWLQQKINTQQTVLIDQIETDHAIGRSMADAPEIDGLVYIESPGDHLAVGDWATVQITHADAYDLHGHLANSHQ